MHRFSVARVNNGYQVEVCTESDNDNSYTRDEYVFETRTKVNKAFKAWMQAVEPQVAEAMQMELEIG